METKLKGLSLSQLTWAGMCLSSGSALEAIFGASTPESRDVSTVHGRLLFLARLGVRSVANGPPNGAAAPLARVCGTVGLSALSVDEVKATTLACSLLSNLKLVNMACGEC